MSVRDGEEPVTRAQPMRRPRTNRTAARYAAAVVAELAQEFPGLHEPSARQAVHNAVQRQAQTPDSAFECIVDEPSVANWRLAPNRDDRRRVRLGCWRIAPSPQDLARQERLNTSLSKLSLED